MITADTSPPTERPPVSPQASSDELLRLYDIIFRKFNQEGDGIWSRFNMLVAINLAVFAAFGFLCVAGGRPSNYLQYASPLCSLGVLLAAWSIYVMRRLWRWHEHWRSKLIAMEKEFPSGRGWVRPHEDSPHMLRVDPGKRRRLITGYTEVFFWGFGLVWAALLGLVVLGRV